MKLRLSANTLMFASLILVLAAWLTLVITLGVANHSLFPSLPAAAGAGPYLLG